MDQEKCSETRFNIGDYVRWPIGVAIFSASDDGEVKPTEMYYAYGIVVDIARGSPPYTDVLIVYCGPGKKHNWIVCHINDDEYQFELMSRGADSDGE